MLLVVAILGVAGCGKHAVDARPSPGGVPAPLEVVVGDPVTAPAVVPVATPKPVRIGRAAAAPTEPEPTERLRLPTERGPDPESEALPTTWTLPIVPGLSFAEAIKKARGARDAFARLPVPASTAKDPSVKAWFGQAHGLVDQASRMYAAAFHAPDAAREGRIDAIAEAAELDMTMARSLDDAGLGALPAAWRSDPAIATTFEDIAVGPTRRWRDEARTLARQCVETARESGVATDAARRCAILRTGAPFKVAKRGADAGAPCACASGDPLCSASLGGWCGSK